jgi:NAD+ synthase
MPLTLPSIDCREAEKTIVGFIENMLERSGCSGLVLGISGGIDSATVASLCVRAAGPSRVLGLIIPTGSTPSEDVRDAEELASGLGIKRYFIDISEMQDSISRLYIDDSKLSQIAYGNIAARLRMILLYLYANSRNLLVVGSGNKSELLVGYFTKYGDGGVDILPIGDLYKTHVKELARWIGVPQRIIDKKPSAGLWPGQTDEDELGITYRELDLILYALIDLGLSVEEASAKTGMDIDKVRRVLRMVERSEHKRKQPPCPSIRHLLR